jgi:O-antigen ligase
MPSLATRIHKALPFGDHGRTRARRVGGRRLHSAADDATAGHTDAPGQHASSALVLWVLIGVYFAASLADKIHPNAAFGVTFVVVSFVFALIHGRQRYGSRDILVFLAICLVVSFSLENASIVTGFPFGHYVYAAVPGPRLYLVPVLIALAYFGSGYLSWVVANVLLGKVDDDPRGGVARFALPIAAAFIMVMWDVGMDRPFRGCGSGEMAAASSACRSRTSLAGSSPSSRSTSSSLSTEAGDTARPAVLPGGPTGSRPRSSTCWSV